MIRPVMDRLGARASRRILSLWPPLSFQRDAAGSHPVGENLIGQAEGEPWFRSRSIQVGRWLARISHQGA